MQYQVFRLLEPSEVTQVVSSLAGLPFVDGRQTAQGLARSVKQNLQTDLRDEQAAALSQLVLGCYRRHAALQSFAFPKRILPPLFSRYEPGMTYGSHVDDAYFSRGGEVLRSDLASTLFLTEPGTYDGGELVLELPIGEQEIKLDAGEAIVYPATTVHRVNPITRGVRLAAVTWIQSAVRDEPVRAILADLGAAIERVTASGDTGTKLLLHKCYHNLLRHSLDV
jgi:PKHD-type hydroxylase